MAGKIYVFGIGGTGSRVLKALTMLLASGVKHEGADAVVPIIVDPDDANSDVTRTVDIMRLYANIRTKIGKPKDGFFGTDIDCVVQNYKLGLNGTRDKKFKDYISLGSMPKDAEAMMRMLFSEKNLEADMQVGFKGNPNIGSVVLNQFAQSPDFINFAQAFTPQDKIFIVSSIFGGTGASGFPLLLKTLRSNNSYPNFANIQKAPIGALSVLPYFDVQQDDASAIDSATFISKTRAALYYYNDGITGNNSIDTIYYIGDNNKGKYDNNEGGVTQRNNAHFVEFASALAILDFAENGVHDLSGGSKTKEFGIKTNTENSLQFADLEDSTLSLVKKPLAQMAFMTRFLCECFNSKRNKQTWDENGNYDDAFRGKEYYRNVKNFIEAFKQWMTEMKDNQVSFTPVSFENDWNTTLCGLTVSKGGLFGSTTIKSGDLDKCMNNSLKYLTSSSSPEYRFMELFYKGTENLLKEKYKF